MTEQTPLLQLHHPALSRPQLAAGHVQGAGRGGRAGNDEGVGQLDLPGQLVDALLQPLRHLRRHHGEVGLQVLVPLPVGGQLGADGEHLVLHLQQQLLHLRVVGQGPGEPHGRDRLVRGPVGLAPGVGLGHLAAEQEPGLSRIASLRVDGHRAYLRSKNYNS